KRFVTIISTMRANAMHITNYIVLGALIACMLWAGAMALHKARSVRPRHYDRGYNDLWGSQSYYGSLRRAVQGDQPRILMLTKEQRAELDALDTETIRGKLSLAGPGQGASVAGFKTGVLGT